MYSKEESLETLQDIKKMMERSSRFISLSGLSGIAAGICALVGIWAVNYIINREDKNNSDFSRERLISELIITVAVIFIAACALAFFFTYLRSKKTGTPLWGLTAKRLLFNMMVPMIAGGVVILRLIITYHFYLVWPLCLVFYGLALFNASKYTLIEIRYLAYAELILGLISFWDYENGLFYWAAGFGVMHIIYGIVMWWKYERVKS
jgi:hypothetical protein